MWAAVTQSNWSPWLVRLLVHSFHWNYKWPSRKSGNPNGRNAELLSSRWKNEIISQPFSYKTKSEFISSTTHLRSNQHTTGFFAATAFSRYLCGLSCLLFIARGGEMTGNEARERERKWHATKVPSWMQTENYYPHYFCSVMLCYVV